MKARIVEARIMAGKHAVRQAGAFLVCSFDEEWDRQGGRRPDGSLPMTAQALLTVIGWTHEDIIAFDLQTGEGAKFRPAQGQNSIRWELQNHMIAVSPLFESFLKWLYQVAPRNVEALPSVVALPDLRARIWRPQNAVRP